MAQLVERPDPGPGIIASVFSWVPREGDQRGWGRERGPETGLESVSSRRAKTRHIIFNVETIEKNRIGNELQNRGNKNTTFYGERGQMELRSFCLAGETKRGRDPNWPQAPVRDPFSRQKKQGRLRPQPALGAKTDKKGELFVGCCPQVGRGLYFNSLSNARTPGGPRQWAAHLAVRLVFFCLFKLANALGGFVLQTRVGGENTCSPTVPG